MASTRKPTIYDVAELAGVSITTVSRVLNSPERVREGTRSQVLAAIDELGFVPKADASARARKDVGRIGVLSPFFTFPSFAQRMRGMAAALADSSIELTIYPVDSLDRLSGYLAMLTVTRRLDGLIVISLPIDDEAAKRLVKHKLETVLIEYNHPSFSSIEIDDYHGGVIAAQYLIKKGHQRCAFVGGADLPDYSLHPEDSRLEGYRRTLIENGLELPDDYIRLTRLSRNGLNQQINALFNLPELPTAVFAATDEVAMRVLKVVREKGLRVPDDMAVMGFDDIDVAEYYGLTTIRQPLDESGQMAVELLLTRLSDPSRSLKNIRLQLTVIERETA